MKNLIQNWITISSKLCYILLKNILWWVVVRVQRTLGGWLMVGPTCLRWILGFEFWCPSSKDSPPSRTPILTYSCASSEESTYVRGLLFSERVASLPFRNIGSEQTPWSWRKFWLWRIHKSGNGRRRLAAKM